MKFSTFANQFATTVEPCALDWEEIVELFAAHREFNGDKAEQLHFNGTEFNKTLYRNNEGVEAIHILVLDFDDGMTLEAAKKHFRPYTHCGYTSYNHQVKKDGKAAVDKFRILLPLSTPCPKDTWLEISHNVKDIAPGVDMSCVRPHQPFAVPLVRKGGRYESWSNSG